MVFEAHPDITSSRRPHQHLRCPGRTSRLRHEHHPGGRATPSGRLKNELKAWGKRPQLPGQGSAQGSGFTSGHHHYPTRSLAWPRPGPDPDPEQVPLMASRRTIEHAERPATRFPPAQTQVRRLRRHMVHPRCASRVELPRWKEIELPFCNPHAQDAVRLEEVLQGPSLEGIRTQ